MQKKASTKTLCYSCTHFFITWQANYPCGCRAFSMKSKALPCLQVMQESGATCLYYHAKTSRDDNHVSTSLTQSERAIKANRSDKNLDIDV